MRLAKMLVGTDRRATAACKFPAFTTTWCRSPTANGENSPRCLSTKPNSSSKSAFKALTGEDGYTTLERRWARPTCDVNGLWSGYQGEGAKTVLPAKAGAKFSFRLVPNQDPHEDYASAAKPISSAVSAGHQDGTDRFARRARRRRAAGKSVHEAAAKAIEHGFGKRPVFIREGGSIPIVTTFQRKLGVDTLLLGWGLDDDNTHSPNEKFCLADFHRGIKASAYLWDELSKLNHK